MREIDKTEAKQLIESGNAGFYAIWANPPILHDTQYVIQSGHRCWLASSKELRIKEEGIVLVRGCPQMLHTVEMDLPDEIGNILQAEMDGCQKIDLGFNIPTYKTNLGDNP